MWYDLLQEMQLSIAHNGHSRGRIQAVIFKYVKFRLACGLTYQPEVDLFGDIF